MIVVQSGPRAMGTPWLVEQLLRMVCRTFRNFWRCRMPAVYNTPNPEIPVTCYYDGPIKCAVKPHEYHIWQETFVNVAIVNQFGGTLLEMLLSDDYPYSERALRLLRKITFNEDGTMFIIRLCTMNTIVEDTLVCSVRELILAVLPMRVNCSIPGGPPFRVSDRTSINAYMRKSTYELQTRVRSIALKRNITISPTHSNIGVLVLAAVELYVPSVLMRALWTVRDILR